MATKAIEPLTPIGHYITIGWPMDMQICWSDNPKARVPDDAWLVPAGVSCTTKRMARWLLARPSVLKRQSVQPRPTGRWVIDDLYGAVQRKGRR